jgi:hypothetical protein
MSGNISLNTVTDGLVLYLDAANPKSYVSGSTTWYDLSIGGNIGTLSSGVTYNYSNGGSLNFNGINDFVSINTNLNISTEFTIEYVLLIRQLPTTGQYFYNFFNGGGYRVNGIYGEFGVDSSNRNYFVLCNLNASGLNTIVRINDHVINTIYYVSVTYQNRTLKGYVNGVLRDTSVLTFDPLNNTSGITSLSSANGSNFSPINMYSFKYYNRALSLSEVLQNYNAAKSRFGL